eukprot:TRINITY_DN5742_c0_g2_i1.p1 TRINITY_DN5742_c0_g2~~TRINITY_DN5742_c0_g2_i1.p1  ORF type:complete len:304 (-),score=62.57 TRINITY_DN5742_c0_g2_i1:122-1033(-)
MRVLHSRLLAVLDAEPARQQQQQQQQSRRPGVPSGGTFSGRTSASDSRADGAGAGSRTPMSQRPPQQPLGDEFGLRRSSVTEADTEESTAFDLLHTERGFGAFEQWYRRALSSSVVAQGVGSGGANAALAWPQVYCPPNLLHEHAFLELLRTFADCSEAEGMDFFDFLDCEFLGMLGLPQVYFAICLVAAVASNQLTKFLFFHSTRLFGFLEKGSRMDAAAGRVSWARLVTLLRLVGAPGHAISKVGQENGVAPLSQLCYEECMDVLFPLVMQLDRGGPFGESTVMTEGDRSGPARSRTCVIL